MELSWHYIRKRQLDYANLVNKKNRVYCSGMESTRHGITILNGIWQSYTHIPVPGEIAKVPVFRSTDGSATIKALSCGAIGVGPSGPSPRMGGLVAHSPPPERDLRALVLAHDRPTAFVQIEYGGRGQVIRTGDCCILLICETAGALTRIRVLGDTANPSGAERIDVSPWGDERSDEALGDSLITPCSADLEAVAVDAALEQLNLGRPAVVLYFDQGGCLYVLQMGDVLVTAEEHGNTRGDDPLCWSVSRAVVDHLITDGSWGFLWADPNWCRKMAGIEPASPLAMFELNNQPDFSTQ